jgi:hypothetical protein
MIITVLAVSERTSLKKVKLCSQRVLWAVCGQ